VNIALHGLESYLLDYVSQREMPKPHNEAAKGSQAKRSALGIIRYADDFVLVHRNKDILDRIILECEKWLSLMGLTLAPSKCQLKLASQSFQFLDFQITYLFPGPARKKGKILICPSKKSIMRVTTKTRQIIQSNKAASAYQLAGKLRPLVVGWGNYFQYCECKETFSKVDNIIYQQLRAWALRRAVRQGRMVVMAKYFPKGNTYAFQGRSYSTNWVFSGDKKTKCGGTLTTHVPKLAWISSKKFAKVKGSYSVYDANRMYWSLRNSKYSFFSHRKTKLLQMQNGYCASCKKAFVNGDVMEVDHIIPKSKGGQDRYSNLQLLHRHCHISKTKNDLTTP